MTAAPYNIIHFTLDLRTLDVSASVVIFDVFGYLGL